MCIQYMYAAGIFICNFVESRYMIYIYMFLRSMQIHCIFQVCHDLTPFTLWVKEQPPR